MNFFRSIRSKAISLKKREVGVGGSKARQNANLNVAFPITFLAAQSYEEGL